MHTVSGQHLLPHKLFLCVYADIVKKMLLEMCDIGSTQHLCPHKLFLCIYSDIVNKMLLEIVDKQLGILHATFHTEVCGLSWAESIQQYLKADLLKQLFPCRMQNNMKFTWIPYNSILNSWISCLKCQSNSYKLHLCSCSFIINRGRTGSWMQNCRESGCYQNKCLNNIVYLKSIRNL